MTNSAAPAGSNGPARRRRSAALNPEMILDAALAVITADGPGALTLRRLGADLGSDHTAVLRHYRGMDELMIAMADRLLREALAGFAPSRHWRDTLTSLARRIRAACLAHPDVAVLVAARTTARDAEFRGADAVIAALHQAGLEGREAARCYRALADLALATAAFEASFNVLEARARDSDRQAWQREYLLASPAQYPSLAAAAPFLAQIDAEDQFQAILELFLDAVELRAQRAGAAPTTRR